MKRFLKFLVLGMALGPLWLLWSAGCQMKSSPSSSALVTSSAATVSGNCTYTLGFWKTHNRTATVPALRMPWPQCAVDPQGEDTLLCGMTWLSILRTPANGNAWIILADQWIAAELNTCNGFPAPADALDAMDQAQTLLTQNCAALDPATPEGQQATTLAAQLEGFNLSNEGPNCGVGTPTPTPEATPTPPPSPVISLFKSASVEGATVGATILYTMNLKVLDNPAHNLQVQDVLPPGLTYVVDSATNLPGGHFTFDGSSTLTWTWEQMDPCNCQLAFQTTVNSDATVGVQIVNRAQASAQGAGPVTGVAGVLILAQNAPILPGVTAP